MAPRWLNKRDAGFIVILVALLMVFVLFAFAGLAVDVSRAYVVKGELQKAADAGALAGAGGLYPTSSGTPLARLDPNWDLANQFAGALIKQNNAANAKLADADIVSIKTGYWNLKQNPPGLQPPSTIPKYACSVSGAACTPNAVVSTCSAAELCMQQDVPAVQVTVQKASLPTSFARVSGWNLFSASASAMAARGNPLTAQLSFPFAVSRCMSDYYLSQGLTGQTIHLPEPYAPVPSCNTGNWTSLNIGGDGSKVVKALLDGTASGTVNIGDSIEIQNGVKDALYQQVADDYIGKTVYLPIVASNLIDNTNNFPTPVTGFMAFRIDSVKYTGNPKYIAGQFLGVYDALTASRLGGPRSNAVTPPVMIR